MASISSVSIVLRRSVTTQFTNWIFFSADQSHLRDIIHYVLTKYSLRKRVAPLSSNHSATKAPTQILDPDSVPTTV